MSLRHTLLFGWVLAGCGTEVTKVEAHLGGDAGKYSDAPICIEVRFQHKKSLALAPSTLCSAKSVAMKFEEVVTGQAATNEVYDSYGKVFLRYQPMVQYGKITKSSEEKDGDTVRISVAAEF